MTISVPVAIPAPGLPLPDPAARATFSARKLEHMRWSINEYATYSYNLGVASYNNALNAQGSATTATAQAGIATAQAGIATTQAGLAAASAASGLTSPGTNATSATSMTIGSGAKSFVLAQTGKSFVVGQWVSVCDSATPTANWMLGAISAFVPGTGAITVTVSASAGALTGTSWVIAASAPIQYGMPVTIVAGTAQTGVKGNHYVMTNAAASTFTLPATPAANDEVWVTFDNGLYTNTVARNGSTIFEEALNFAIVSGVLLTYRWKYLNNDWKAI
jgi:hypothetical protein